MALRTDELLIPQGTTWEVRWPIQGAGGTTVDLTNWKVRAQARKTRRDETVLFDWSTDLGNASIVDGSVSLKVSPEESSAWTWTSAVFDVELFHPDGRVVRVTQGSIQIDSEVTR